MINCLKRTVVCVIMDESGNVLGIGRNQCKPPYPNPDDFEGIINGEVKRECVRMHITATKHDYDSNGCNSVHAEVNAIANIKEGDTRKPTHAVLMGHDFPCDPCEQALRDIGVRVIQVVCTGKDDRYYHPLIPPNDANQPDRSHPAPE